MAEETKEIMLPIEWESDEDKLAQFVNHITITFDGAGYTLRFYQVLPPVVNKDNPDSLRSIHSVKGRHVTTLAISDVNMRSILQTLVQTVTNIDAGRDE